MPLFTSFYDILWVSIRQVVRQRRRYFGVILAVSLGTAGFVVILTLGRDVKKNVNHDLDLLGGATLIKVYFEEYVPARDRLSQPQWFRGQAVEALRSVPGVGAASVAVMKTSAGFSSVHDNRYYYPLLGVDGFFWSVNGISAVKGTLFDGQAVAERRRVVVLGAELAQKIFGDLDVVGRLMPIDNDIYEVGGVVAGLSVGDRIRFAFIPITTAQDRLQGITRPERLYVRCLTWDDVAPVAAVIPKVIGEHQPVDRLRVDVAWDQLKHVQRVVWWVELFIYFSIGATLTLGGFGIWNGMMAGVQARTREIGLKKAMGAEDRDVLFQFLMEALCLSLGSALLGVGLSRVVIEVARHLLGSRPPEDLFILSACLCLLLAVVIGVTAGLYPSIRASRMEVVKAMKYE